MQYGLSPRRMNVVRIVLHGVLVCLLCLPFLISPRCFARVITADPRAAGPHMRGRLPATEMLAGEKAVEAVKEVLRKKAGANDRPRGEKASAPRN